MTTGQQFEDELEPLIAEQMKDPAWKAAFEAAEAETDGTIVCVYCEMPIREEDDRWTDVLSISEGGSHGYCATGPDHEHSPEKTDG